VKEDDRPPLPQLVIGEFDAVGGSPTVNDGLSHGPKGNEGHATSGPESPQPCRRAI